MQYPALVIAVSMLGGCASVANIAAFGGGVATGAVVAKDRGDAIITVGGGAHVGSRDVPAGSTASGRGVGASVISEGVGIASNGGVGWAAHSRVQLGIFGDDYWFGEIDLEAGPGYLHRGNVGGGVVAGWNYGGQFDATNSIPVRAIAYWSSTDVVVAASAHISYRSDSESWTGRGGELAATFGKVGVGVRYEDQNGASVVSATAGWSLHTRMQTTK